MERIVGEGGEPGAQYLGGAVPVQSADLAGGRPPARQCVVAGIGKALGMAATLRQIWEENKEPYSIIHLPLVEMPPRLMLELGTAERQSDPPHPPSYLASSSPKASGGASPVLLLLLALCVADRPGLLVQGVMVSWKLLTAGSAGFMSLSCYFRCIGFSCFPLWSDSSNKYIENSIYVDPSSSEDSTGLRKIQPFLLIVIIEENCQITVGLGFHQRMLALVGPQSGQEISGASAVYPVPGIELAHRKQHLAGMADVV